MNGINPNLGAPQFQAAKLQDRIANLKKDPSPELKSLLKDEVQFGKKQCCTTAHHP